MARDTHDSDGPKAPNRRAVHAERQAVMRTLKPVVELLGGIVGPHLEVVLHDLRHPERSVVAIANGHVSGRGVGSAILSGPRDDRAFVHADRERSAPGGACSLVHAYPTASRDGRPLRSSTAVFRDSAGEPFAALCVNTDLAPFVAAHAWLERLLESRPAPAPPTRRAPPPVPAADMDRLIADVIADALNRGGKPVPQMSRDDKVQAVRTMSQRGLFVVRGGVGRAAAALGVSRYTVYNYLALLRPDAAERGPPGPRTRVATERPVRGAGRRR